MEFTKSKAEQRLNIAREAELLQSFVRISVKNERENEEEKNQVENEETVAETDEARIRQAPMSPEVCARLAKEMAADEANKKKGKKKRKKNALRQEEVYCDKDRAAAVNMGSRDIKQSLKIKRKQERSKILQIPEEAEPSTFLALGNYEMCRGDLEIAVDFMSKALELNPSEKNSLVARSKCYILLGQPENALKDAEAALLVDKTFIKAIYQKAEALYYLGDFEHGLMYYHRGLHIRPDHQGFKLGVEKSQKAIENAIGSFALVKKSGKSSNETSSNQRSSVSGLSRSRSGKSSRLLRELASDKDYLDNLMNNPDIKCKFKDGDETIERCVKETVEYLNARQEFWRQQLPKRLK